jgi:2-polyprenyl-3-methyl-5-hydroxy-6-metoxy-1,4-benzoquinol methylase
VATCSSCGIVQKPIDAAWHEEASAIYAGYALYHQSATRTEQNSFDVQTGVGVPRSVHILNQLTDFLRFDGNGRMLDIGCGIGVTLRAFHQVAPGWSLDGHDPNLKDIQAVASLPGVATVHGGELADLMREYNCITCMHVLEHVIDPLPFLCLVRDLLTEDGIFLAQVPYFHDNYFDLAIADHCSHFTPETIAPLCAAAGLEIVFCSTEVVAREMTILARPTMPVTGFWRADLAASQRSLVSSGFQWLSATVEAARDAAGSSDTFGIFGTSIAGTWIASQIDGRIKFFVDEDSSRIGGKHLGKPIVSPQQIPAGSRIFVALVPKVASMVAQRLSTSSAVIYEPPTWIE